MNKQLKKFNHQDTVIVITSLNLPKKGEKSHNELNAISWHSEKTLRELSKTHKVLVLAQKNGQKESVKINPNFQVKRSWSKGNIWSVLSLFRTISQFNLVKTVYIPFEFNVFGGIIPNLGLLALLFFLKLTGKYVVFEQHQVILEIKKLEKHIHITNPLAQKFYDFGLRHFYRFLNYAVSQVIVFEEDLKKRLSSFIPAEKIHTLSLAVKKHTMLSKLHSKKALGFQKDEFVLMVFGFINGYKGIDWIVREFQNVKAKKIRLLIAGGKNPYLKGQLHYELFYQSIKAEIKKDKRIVKTGFVEDTEISKYYSAADLVVLPYEVFMSASGPFSLALSYRKPIILSQALADYSLSADFNQAMKDSGLKNKDLFFALKNNSFRKLLYRAKNNPSYLYQLSRFAKLLAVAREQHVIDRKYQELLFPKPSVSRLLSKSFKPALRVE